MSDIKKDDNFIDQPSNIEDLRKKLETIPSEIQNSEIKTQQQIAEIQAQMHIANINMMTIKNAFECLKLSCDPEISKNLVYKEETFEGIIIKITQIHKALIENLHSLLINPK